MRIVAQRPQYRPTWLHTAVLERIWKASGTPYVASWSGIPVFPDWFEYEGGRPVAFRTADMDLVSTGSAPSVTFVDGRHRTRWLMGRFALVPVGLEEIRFELAVSIGLAARRVTADDTLPTFDYSWRA